MVRISASSAASRDKTKPSKRPLTGSSAAAPTVAELVISARISSDDQGWAKPSACTRAQPCARSGRRRRMTGGGDRRRPKIMDFIRRSGRRPGNGLGGIWPRIRWLHVDGARRTLGRVDGETNPSESDNVRRDARSVKVVRQSKTLGFAGNERGSVAGEPSWSGTNRADTLPGRVATRRPQRTARRLEQLKIDRAVSSVDCGGYDSSSRLAQKRRREGGQSRNADHGNRKRHAHRARHGEPDTDAGERARTDCDRDTRERGKAVLNSPHSLLEHQRQSFGVAPRHWPADDGERPSPAALDDRDRRCSAGRVDRQNAHVYRLEGSLSRDERARAIVGQKLD